jgi:hypothetical protein
MRIKAISIIIIMMSFIMISFSQMDMKAMDKKKDSVDNSQKKKIIKKIAPTKSSSSKKDTIKVLNDPITNISKESGTMKMNNDMKKMDMKNINADTANKTVVKDTMKMSDYDMMNMNEDTTKPRPDNMSDMNMDMPLKGSSLDSMNMNMMNDAFSLNLPMKRHGSGTGWLPDASPMIGYMFHSAKWMYMLHGNLFIRYNN